ncbi:hypothetical protein KKF91_12120 [Myxococcota bacterium]|nr:hypothetical protein [Myxococcota bacterium]MBU1431277.1 hypothetical protein [Myxococcota bacterium]MBU1900459.1 hypothetical protein [Myxococcota bacterium]
MLSTLKTSALILSVIFFASQLGGCGSAQKQIRKNLGVKSKRISMSHFGNSYSKYKNTQFDVFSTNKNTRQLTKRKNPIKVDYLNFKIKSFDDVNHSANLLYAKYEFAYAMQDRVLKDVNDLFNLNILKVNSKELNRALRKSNASELSQVRKIQDSIKNLEASMRSIPDFISQASGLVGQTRAASTQVVADLQKDPIRAVLIPDLTAETFKTTKRLEKVISGTPKLISRYKKLLGILGPLF